MTVSLGVTIAGECVESTANVQLQPTGLFCLDTVMDIRIIKDSEVTIHDQLVEEITFSIATGNLKPGQALPSVRALARRLKIHHNTVSQVYQDLVGRNLLIRRRGSRMVVRSPGEREYPPRVEDLDDLINATIQAAQEKGYTLQQLRQRVQERLMALPPDHLLAVSSDPGIRYLLREELKENLPFPVEACSPDDLSQNPELTVGALVVGAPGAIPKIVSLVPKDRPAISITFSALDEHVKMIRQLRKPVLLQASVVEPCPLRQSPTWKGLKSNLENPATTIIKTNKKNAARLVNTSRKESLLRTNPACIAGVLTVLPNLRAECGRTKL